MKISSIKVTILVDADKKMFFDIHMRTTRRHDKKIGVRLLKRNMQRLSVVIADKGYNDDRIREILERKEIKPMIRRMKFSFREKMKNDCMDKKLYGRRNIVESVISSVKRKYGGWVRSKVWFRQFREIMVKHFVYNLDLALRSLAFIFKFFPYPCKKKGFLQSQNGKKTVPYFCNFPSQKDF